MAGQSNALGEQTAYDNNLDAPHPRVFVWTQHNGWQNANLRTQIWRINYLPSAEGRGSNHPGFQIAKAIANRDSNRVIAFIPTGVAGRPISHWFGGYWNTLRSVVQSALQGLPNNSKVDMIWWMQGESDFNASQAYRSSLHSLINNQFRGQNWFDTGLFIANETFNAPVNQIFRELDNDNDPYTFSSAAAGLSTRDNVHFDARALRTIGQRVADVFLRNSP